MDVEVMREELRVDGAAADGRAALAELLGPPDRSVTTDRTVAGIDDLPDVTIHVWDHHGIMAGEGWVAFAVGRNVLDEPVWPDERHRGRITLDGDDLGSASLGVDPLREDRRVGELGRWAITLVVDWDATPGKLVVRRQAQAPDGDVSPASR